MANTGFKGIDVKQTGTALVFDVLLQSGTGSLVTTGTTTLSICELQSDGTLKTFDFNGSGSFVTTAPTTATVNMTHQTYSNGSIGSGVWTYALTNLTAFTIGAVYYYMTINSGATPTNQVRKFQYGGAEGDLAVTSNGTGVAEVNSDVKFWNGTVVTTPATAGIPDINVKNINNVSAASVTTINANVGTTQPTNFSGTGTSAYIKADAEQLNGQAVTAAAGVTFPSSIASPTNITAGAITTVSGNVTGSVGSVTGNVGGVAGVTFPATVASPTNITAGTITTVSGNVNGSVGSVTGSVGSVTGSVGSVTGIVTANTTQLAGQTVTAAAGVTFPTSVASPTNITSGTITTVTNLTNAPTNGDFTSTMKASITTAATSATPTVLLTPGTSTGQVSLTAGVLTASLSGDLTSTMKTSVATAVWQDTTSGDFTVSGSIGKALFVNAAPGATGGHFIAGTNAATTVTTAFTTTFTGNLTGSVGSVTGAVGSVTGSVGSVTGNVGGVSGVTFPATVASPTNITSATGIVLAGVNHTGAVIPTVTTVTNQLTQSQIATGVWQDTTAGDFIVSGSIGKSLFTSGNAPGASSGLALVGSNVGTVTSVTGSVGSVTGNVGGNVVGSVGSVSGNVGGVAGVTFPSTVASPTNITSATGVVLAGVTHTGAVIPTVTNLTNAPTNGDFTSTMKTSISTLVPNILTGTVVTGSTTSSVIVSGFPAGMNYVGQALYNQISGEVRIIATQSYSGSNYTFGFTGTDCRYRDWLAAAALSTDSD